MNTEGKHDAFAALRLKDFRLFISFRFFLTMAVQMQSVIVGWQVYELTKDPLSLGFAGLAEAIPFVAVALYAGHVADRFSRKRTILAFESLFLLGTVGLLVFSIFRGQIYARAGIIPVYAIVALTGVARSFIYPSTIALMSALVPRHMYPNSSTWNSTTWHFAAISGPAAGGLIYGFFGAEVTYSVIILLVLTSFTLLALVVKDKVVPVDEKEPVWARMKSGVRFVVKNQVLLGSMSLDMLAVLFGGAISMLPIFAAEILDTGPKGLGFLRAAPMVGAVVVSVSMAFRPPVVKAGRTMLLSVMGFGLSWILFALSRNYYLSFGLLVLSGMFDNISVVIRVTAMQLITPDEMRGRVASVNSIFIGSSNEIGSFESGLAARIMGLVPSVIFGGGMTILITGAMGRMMKELRKLNLRERS